MRLDFKTYYDKVKGCYLGKNIGGTLGAPFECYRGVYDIDGFMQDVSEPVPNDDVDLQLVWLAAAEHEGRAIDSSVLAEYWSTYVSSVISEYGTGKNNVSMGIMPPLSGYMRNVNKDSNGAWIRTEIWACLCAGNPALAANYAYYDACVDHADEGVNAAVFIAAIESAAFFETNVDTLLDIGLSYIPKDCAVRRAVDLVRADHRNGVDWKEVRLHLFKEVPSSFGEMGGLWRGTAEVAACSKCLIGLSIDSRPSATYVSEQIPRNRIILHISIRRSQCIVVDILGCVCPPFHINRIMSGNKLCRQVAIEQFGHILSFGGIAILRYSSSCSQHGRSIVYPCFIRSINIY